MLRQMPADKQRPQQRGKTGDHERGAEEVPDRLVASRAQEEGAHRLRRRGAPHRHDDDHLVECAADSHAEADHGEPEQNLSDAVSRRHRIINLPCKRMSGAKGFYVNRRRMSTCALDEEGHLTLGITRSPRAMIGTWNHSCRRSGAGRCQARPTRSTRWS